MRGDLYSSTASALQLAQNARKTSRRPAKIVVGNHHACRGKSTLQLILVEIPGRLDFDIAPTATGADRLRQDLNLLPPAAAKLAASLPGCGKWRSA